MKGYTRGYTVYWYNPEVARTGYVEYTTYSEERAVALFRKDYDESYGIVGVN